ncbi:MAG: protein phosphatase 2C domain-containing protein [Tannerella sp.]|jgi:serine/threonine protein phosphatase PrpC|nr:protein phosphatase 2C domain-containing protein [Tannerella sp.]
MADIIFRLAARCEAAGRPNNEDNFLISDNLESGEWGFLTDKEITLSDKGALLVVADGMGGMKAGEVASALAVKTIKEWFAPANITDKVTNTTKSVKDYIRKGIQEADAVIKKESADNETKSGMGSTIVLSWLTGQGQIVVGWCGDSRAYRYNPKDGLILLSHDHSYVQELVDNGKLDASLAFDYPDKNIITRSLGNPSKKAEPDIKEFYLRSGDIFLLCSDGLSGVLRDAELETIISHNTESLAACREALWTAAFEAGWEDNVTLILCQALKVGDMPVPEPDPIPFISSQPTLRQENMFLSEEEIKEAEKSAKAAEATETAETEKSETIDFEDNANIETPDNKDITVIKSAVATPAETPETAETKETPETTTTTETTTETTTTTETAQTQETKETKEPSPEEPVIEPDLLNSPGKKRRWMVILVILAAILLLLFLAYRFNLFDSQIIINNWFGK